jgi:hypothetical protein
MPDLRGSFAENKSSAPKIATPRDRILIINCARVQLGENALEPTAQVLFERNWMQGGL